ncbi:MAG: hypothetical protein P8Y70_01650 [Candidatus Lokiarchaeota archaeon]
MEVQQKQIYKHQLRKILSVIDTKSDIERCTVCGNRLFPAVLESWKADILVDFKIQNGFCEHCGLFQFEPEESTEFHFQKPKHRKLYKQSLQSFT